MAKLVEDARRVRAGEQPLLRPVRDPSPKETPLALKPTIFQRLYYYLKDQVQYTITNQTSEDDDEWVIAVARMIAELRTRTEAHETLAPINYVKLSIPTSLANVREIYSDRLTRACRRAGVKELKHHGNMLAAKAVLDLYDISGHDSDEDEPDQTSRITRVSNVFALDYSRTSFGVALLTNYLGLLHPEQGGNQYFSLGANSPLRHHNEYKYWMDIKAIIEESIKPLLAEEIDYLVLLGESAAHPAFLQMIKEVFHINPNVNPSDYAKSTEEHLYVAARGVARIARYGMRYGFEACIMPDHCPVLEEEETPKQKQHGEL
ncbi:MAG: hypothetical protein M1812_007580 [Candelaria pacifica]|nr:MAG: hypothetical protein M1812_007580 [Candelaria pacifica]